MKPVINTRKCPAQEAACLVIAACPNGAIRYIQDDQARLGGRIVVDEARCDGCGTCVSACCGQAIDLAAA